MAVGRGYFSGVKYFLIPSEKKKCAKAICQ